MDHENNFATSGKGNATEYFKFAGVLAGITFLSLLLTMIQGFDAIDWVRNFMAVFFITFAVFKIIDLKEFAYGFQSYDLIAAKSLTYSYYYPFLQLIFGVFYLLGADIPPLDFVVLIISLISAAGVSRALGSGAKVKCLCLGRVIKLPLSTISFVEDFGMALMALIMLIV